MLVAISKSLVIYEANPNDIATPATVAPITKPTQGAACEGDTRVRGYKTSSYLPSQIFVVRVSDVQTLGGEGVRLNFNVGSGDFVDETGLANVWKSYRRRSINI